jgi:glycosyltransferase A (GT-A) superfamily protein (DUF2064 family)
MNPAPIILVVAKAPVAGQAKTRLAASIGAQAAADLAAAALLDTLAAAVLTAHRLGSGPAVLALSGDLAQAARSQDLRTAMQECRIIRQRGEGLARRLAAAHADCAGLGGGPVLQIGMDTPQVDADLLQQCATRLGDAGAVLGPAADGGWWLLAVRRAATAQALQTVPMSTSRTGELTRSALSARVSVCDAPVLRDVDTLSDARAVAQDAPHTRFATALAGLDTRLLTR